MQTPEVVHYVIVVHGIGEQRKNESVIAVVNRFAEARRMEDGCDREAVREGRNMLTLGKATGQTGKYRGRGNCRFKPPENAFQPWLEYEGIPATAAAGSTHQPFRAEYPKASELGTNMRFVDMWWADVMQDDFPDVGQDVETWTEGLTARLDNKARGCGADPKRTPPRWALLTVELIQSTAVLLRKILSLRAQAFENLIFNDFLGDVQLYGEYAHTRGRAVARFHRTMARIERDHMAENERLGVVREARYHVIAHSLGTVMSMDALMYAHADRALRAGDMRPEVRNLPFRGYHATSGEAAELDVLALDAWITRVDSFVTLGSPIDKYLTLWWENYKYLNAAPEQWMDPRFLKLDPIRHYNYCEEQDPVGHNLDLAASAPGFAHVFRTLEDIVYIRDRVPGGAHLAYWDDLELFRRILKASVDAPIRRTDLAPDWLREDQGKPGGAQVPGGAPDPAPVAWFLPKVYDQILFITYKLVPITVCLLNFAAFAWMWAAEGLTSVLAGAIAFLVVTYLGARILDLSVMWRQVLRMKRARNMEVWCVDPSVIQKPAARFRAQLNRRAVVFTLLAAVLSFSYAFLWAEVFPWHRIALIGALLGLLLLLAHQFLGGTGRADHAQNHNLQMRALRPMFLVLLAALGGLALHKSDWGITRSAEMSRELNDNDFAEEFFQTDTTQETDNVTSRTGQILFHLTALLCIFAVVADYRRRRFRLVQEGLYDSAGKPLDPELKFTEYGAD